MAINEKQPGDCGYVAFFQGQRIELYAPSQYQAHLKAVAHFRPSKKQLSLLTVVLAEREDGSVVVHTPDF